MQIHQLNPNREKRAKKGRRATAGDVSLAETVYESLKERIVSFSLRPATALTESALASEFKVSRTPVREALQLLCMEGLVEMIPSRGVRVAEGSFGKAIEAYTVRELLEPYACGLAAERISPDQFSELEEVSKLFSNSIKTHQQAVSFELLNRRFHSIILKASLNESICDIVKRMMWTTQQVAFYVSSSRYNKSAQEHKLILDCLGSSEMGAARKAMKSHLTKAKHRLLR